MTAPSLDALRDVLRNAPNPADVLPQLWEMAARRLLPLEQVLELAASPDLAGSATPASCQRLVEALQGVAEEVGEARMLASILDLHAAALVECARYREALILYDAVLPFLHRYAPPTVVGICLMNCALALQHLGRLAEAVASYDAGLPLLPAHEYTLAAQCLLWRAIALGKLGRHAEALAGYNAALPLLQAHDPSNVTPCLLYRAITLGKLGRQAEAVASIDPLLRQHHASQSSCRDSYTPPIRVASASDLEEEMDHYFEAQGRQVEAESWYAEREAESRRLDPSLLQGDELRRYHGVLGDVYWHTGRRDQAMQHYAKGRLALRQTRKLAGIDDSSLEFIAERRSFLNKCVRRALDLVGPEEAFAAVQDGKGSVLGDLRQRLNRTIDDEPPDIATTRRALNKCLRNPPRKPAEDAPETAKERYRRKRDKWLNVREERTGAYLRAWGRHWHAYRPELPAWLAEDDPVPLERIQAALPADWALLDFWRTGNDEVTAFVVFRDALHVQKLPITVSDETFAGHLQGLLWSIEHPLDPPHDEALEDLDEYLLDPLRPLLRQRGIRGLYLVPHGFLHALPLHACRSWNEKDSKWVYLCDDYAVAYLPSASLLPQLPPLRLDGPVLSLANPEPGTEMTLPFSDREGRILRQRLGRSAGRFHLGPEATFRQTDRWEDAALLHFSCHGLGDMEFGPRSHLRLADDLLLAHDVVYRRPPIRDGALTILNGCQTAVRDWRAVEEGMGLMSAFLLRGASLVLATQWSVVDACAAEMVLAFLAEVRKGTAPTDALRQAQNSARQMASDVILGVCDEVSEQFPGRDFPWESAKTHVQAASVCKRAGRIDEAKRHAELAATCLRRLGRHRDAERVLSLVRGGSGLQVTTLGSPGFDHPIFWGAFHLVGRVT